MAYFIGTLFLPTFYGVISGLAWAAALRNSLLKGCYYGALIGLFAGIVFYLMGKAARFRGNVQKREATVMSGGIITIIFVLVLLFALGSWVVRLIFFF